MFQTFIALFGIIFPWGGLTTRLRHGERVGYFDDDDPEFAPLVTKKKECHGNGESDKHLEASSQVSLAADGAWRWKSACPASYNIRRFSILVLFTVMLIVVVTSGRLFLVASVRVPDHRRNRRSGGIRPATGAVKVLGGDVSNNTPLVSSSFPSSSEDKESEIDEEPQHDKEEQKENAVIADHGLKERWKAIKVDPNPTAQHPRIAWLMSFPNSGTTYTALLVRTITNSSTASNNGQECHPVQTPDGEKLVLPVHANRPQGPFLHDPRLGPPDSYILSKTHCGGRCFFCSPTSYVETYRSFEYQCRLGKKLTFTKDTTTMMVTEPGGDSGMGNATMMDTAVIRYMKKRQETSYDTSMVSRAVHLVRNPYDNIVARLHYALKNRNKEFKQSYSDTPEGLHSFCKESDAKYDDVRQEMRYFDRDMMRIATNVPCRDEFYKYVQWHNLAFELSYRLQLPTHVLHYEDYGEKMSFQQTVHDLLSFLNMTRVGGIDAPEFVTGKHYEDYFTLEERIAIMTYVKELASPETWSVMKRYFHSLLEDE